MKMPTQTERIGIVETRIENLTEKIDDLKSDVKDVHDCLDKTRDDLTFQLEKMYNTSCSQHAEMANKITSLEKSRDKWIWTIAGAIAVIGWVSGHTEIIFKIFG
jgi:flagellar capping protein FliD